MGATCLSIQYIQCAYDLLMLFASSKGNLRSLDDFLTNYLKFESWLSVYQEAPLAQCEAHCLIVCANGIRKLEGKHQ